MTYHPDDANESVTGRRSEITINDVVQETLINLERIEGQFASMKRRLLEHLELSGGADF